MSKIHKSVVVSETFRHTRQGPPRYTIGASRGKLILNISWYVKLKSGLIAVDPLSVDRKLRDAKAHLPRGFLTRRRRDSGRGERLSGIICNGGHGGRCPLSRYRAHLAFPSRKLRVALTRAMGQQPR